MPRSSREEILEPFGSFSSILPHKGGSGGGIQEDLAEPEGLRQKGEQGRHQRGRPERLRSGQGVAPKGGYGRYPDGLRAGNSSQGAARRGRFFSLQALRPVDRGSEAKGQNTKQERGIGRGRPQAGRPPTLSRRGNRGADRLPFGTGDIEHDMF